MGLQRWEPFSELQRMRSDMDRLFGSLMSPSMISGKAPAIDVWEEDNNVMVKAELPGLKKEDLEVTAMDDSIRLKGEFKHEEEKTEKGYFIKERSSGSFTRMIPMPTAIKPDQVKASFKDGVLEITAPKSEEEMTKEKKVQIES